MKIVLPRVILGNRGDLASRWGLLLALRALGVDDVTVFAALPEDVPEIGYLRLPYGRVRNLLPGRAGWRALRRADTVVWGVGLDMQDDSSLAKLAYLNVAFRLYRMMGARVMVLFQGAGPLTTSPGRFLARHLLHTVDLFVARDPGTFHLLKELSPGLNAILGHDAIFLPGLEAERRAADNPLPVGGRPWIGFNLRQWFHFSSSIFPYQFARRRYLRRSQARMADLLNAAERAIRGLRMQGTVLLISAYQPHTVPWEDDLHWLEQIKSRFPGDERVVLVDWPMSIPAYFDLMSRLDLMVGMRLHSTLIALRFGVPSLNISYTLKGGDILRHLGLERNAILLDDFLQNPMQIVERAQQMLAHPEAERAAVQRAVAEAMDTNMAILRRILGG